jgi:V8-like Glu-specific endopeptidase
VKEAKMKSKTPGANSRKPDRPQSLDTLLGMDFEPPKAVMPDAMQSFAGWNGLIVDQSAGPVKQRVGFQRLETHRDMTAWVMTADYPYQFGLPILSIKTIERTRRTGSKARGGSIAEPLHHAWNARCFNPVPATITQEILLNAKGKRVVPMGPMDALIFGLDDRKPYRPNAYPWNCIGRLESGGVPIGSAALVGRNLILTARHVILGKTAAPIKFVPAYYNGQSTVSPFFFSWAKSAIYYSGSDAGAWDFALLRLYQPLGDHLGFFGVRAYDDDWDDLSVWANAGYPAMAPFNSQVPSYLLGVSIYDEETDGAASELDSKNQDCSKGNSGGPLWGVWPQGPHIVGVTSANHKVDLGPFGSDHYEMNAGGRAMVEMVGLARLEIDTTIHVNPPHLNLG